ncbi:MAG: cytochrome c family protein [Alphaproteobacteria bacterium]|nr:cytochrome c family protein [Alphaproteobacteria bacterium]
MNMEFNKLFAAALVAGIVAMLAGFVANHAYLPEKLKENAYPIEVTEVAAGGEAAAPAGPEPVGDLLASADVAHGEKLSKVCAACHTFNSGGANRVGPNLWHVVGGKHAHAAGFAYSDAMKAKAGEVWTVEALNEFLWNPRKALPGTKMVYAGMKKPEDRAAMIKYLESLK